MKNKIFDIISFVLQVVLGILAFQYQWAFNLYLLVFWVITLTGTAILALAIIGIFKKYVDNVEIPERPKFTSVKAGTSVAILVFNIVVFAALGYGILTVIAGLYALSWPVLYYLWDFVRAEQLKEKFKV